jgi:hypothetical protein
MAGALQRSYDLTLRLEVGARHHYTCSEVWHVLDTGGRTARREERASDLLVEVRDPSPGSHPRLAFTYSDFAHATKTYDLEDDFALPEWLRSRFDAAPGDSVVPISGRVEFEAVPESLGSFYPDVAAFGLPMAAAPFLTAELIIHTRAFWIIATRTHGGLHDLSRVGDRTQMPWTGTQDSLLGSTITHGPSDLRLEGLATRHGLDVALIGYYMPYDIAAPGAGPGHAEPLGHIWIDLTSGAIVAGSAYQTNYMAGVPVGEHVEVLNARVQTSIELVP